MSIFNFKIKRKDKNTINRAGGQAFKQSPEMELISLLLTSFAQDQYYRKAEDTFKDLVKALKKINPLFAAKAAVYARTEFGMRSITHVLAVELAAYVAGQPWAKGFYNKIVKRPDDMLEIAAYFKTQGGKGLPNAMKKGFAKAFDKFDGYQIAKHRGEDKSIKLIDLVNLIHPVPTQKNAQALQALVDGTLRNSQTWESQLTQAGQAAKSEKDKVRLKAEVWKNLLRENKLGYFALVRNLRNILQQAPNMTHTVCQQLTDRERIKKSLVLPFRLLVAYKQLNGTDANMRKVRNALERAINIACDNVPYLENTLVVVDNSGSMASNVANSPHVKCNEVGAMFGMVLAKRCNADILEFGNHARFIGYDLNESVISFSKSFEKNNKVGHGTNFHSIFKTAKKRYDRIVIFSDMQGWIGHYSPKKAYENYKQKTGADPFIYSFDLRGYGSLQFPERKVLTLAGFSEKVFDLMKIVEKDKRALVRAVEAIELN
ncbi:MAG: TROVE domain-containing protein [Bacteroidota bacterium]